MMHQATEMMIKPPIMMSAMTGHLALCQRPAAATKERGDTHLQ
jgi:hypothetical protein